MCAGPRWAISTNIRGRPSGSLGETVCRGSMSSSDAAARSGSRTPQAAQRTLSIEWKLPLLITAVLAAGLAAFLAFTYFTLARRSETVVRDRFIHASRLVA